MISFEDAKERASGNPTPVRDPVRESRAIVVFVRFAVLCLYSSAIVFLGTRRQIDFPGDDILTHDKILHGIAFGGVGVLSYRLIRFAFPQLRGRVALLGSVGAAFTLGAVLELIQAQLPYRSMEFADLVADTLGAVFFVGVAQWMRLDRPLRHLWWV